MTNKQNIDFVFKALVLVVLAYIGYVVYDFQQDRNAAKADVERAATIAEHCRIMAAVGRPCD